MCKAVWVSLLMSILFTNVLAQTALPCDKNATPETVNLYNNLKRVLDEGVMLGHQDALAYGVGWQYQRGRSDVKDVTGDHPAVMGFEVGRLETGEASNLDGVPFSSMQAFIREAYEQGSVITISWHLNNPLTGKTAWDPSPKETVAAILPGGAKNGVYNEWLDKLATFFKSLKGSGGEYIPVVFRPFHELNGSWFWWGGRNCTPAEIKELYRYTQYYLRNIKGVHHLLYAFNTDKFGSAAELLERYPGDEYVDVIGFDIYQHGTNEEFKRDAGIMLATLDSVAAAHAKIPALTEFGYSNLPDAGWFTATLLPLLKAHPVSWALAWRNAGVKADGTNEFYLPYKGHAAANDFAAFCNSPYIWLQQEAAGQKLYQ